MRTDLQAIVLAAGKSSRINSGSSKLLEKICGQELILYPTKLLDQLQIQTSLIVGYQKEQVIKTVQKHHSNISFVEQEKQSGTGHAFLVSRSAWCTDNLLVLNGDVPLLTPELILSLEKKHTEANAAISFVTSHNNDPSGKGYGRIIKNEKSITIVEARELTQEQLQEHCCINAGIYLISRSFAQEVIDTLKPNQVSNELHITDLVKLANEKNLPVTTVSASFDTIRGINTLEELWAVEQIKRSQLIRYWMERGVRFLVPQSVLIDLPVTIGKGTTIGCGVHLLGKTTIGKKCTVGSFTAIENATINDHVTINSHCIIKDSILYDDVSVGPFAYLRDHVTLKEHSIIGSFVEVKKSTIGQFSKAKHLSYLGDATIGNHVNIGAGTITCNHDGLRKHKTTIEDHAYIGSNNSLVAPLIIGRSAFTAAGSVITEPVPTESLAIGRARQINKPEYAKKLRQKYEAQEQSNIKTANKKNGYSFMGAIKTDRDEFYTK